MALFVELVLQLRAITVHTRPSCRHMKSLQAQRVCPSVRRLYRQACDTEFKYYANFFSSTKRLAKQYHERGK